MTHAPVNLSPALLLLVGLLVKESFQVLVERIFWEPYPRNAWGSWLCRGWAAVLAVTVIQFVVGTIVHSERLGTSFLAFGLPTILYAVVLTAVVRKMFPKPPSVVPEDFLLKQFQENYRRIYAGVFFLAIMPFIMGFSAFGDRMGSPPQIVRIIWMVCAIVGFYAPPTRLLVHKALILIGGPLTVVLLALYSHWYGG